MEQPPEPPPVSQPVLPDPPAEDFAANNRDLYVLVIGLFTALVVIGVTYFYVRRSNLKASAVEEAPWLEGLATEIPEAGKAAFEAAYDDKTAEALRDSADAVPRMADEVKEMQELREELCDKLRQRTREFVAAWLPARREMKVVGRTQERGLISDEQYDAAIADFEALKEERTAIMMAAHELRPGLPGWGAAIFQEAYDSLLDASRKARAAGGAEGGEGGGGGGPGGGGPGGEIVELAEEHALRFRVGARVECNMGPRGFLPGSVREAWDLPYNVTLDGGELCSAPVDLDQYIRHASPLHAARPEADVREVPLDLWVPRDAPPRFPEGSVVMARFGEHYHRGTVVKARPSTKQADGRDVRHAYAIKIEPSAPGERSRVVTAPVDLDVVVRRATADEKAKRALPEPEGEEGGTPRVTCTYDQSKPLRFAVGDRVMANLGERGYVRAAVVGLSPDVKQRDGSTIKQAYALQIDQQAFGQPGPVVFAPRDDDTSARVCTADEAGAPLPLLTKPVRFEVGTPVLANMGTEVGFVPGKVVGLKPSVDPPPGKGGAKCLAAYEVALEGVLPGEKASRVVFAPRDEDSCVRLRTLPNAPQSTPASGTATTGGASSSKGAAKGKQKAKN